ncbi:hypothetical protein B0H19DRAFT_1256842 [Mycena capillaripes]|nr:hypothetical protein B0H19DRAFT_1256842 [Mycena capillaripes]
MWHALVVSLPNLWTSITISTTLSVRELSFLSKQLKRSGSAPLDIVIRFTSGWRSIQAAAGAYFTSDIDFDSNWLPPTSFAALGPKTLRLLEKLVLSGGSARHLTKYEFFRAAPALRHVLITYKATYDAATHFRNLTAAANLVECDIGVERGGGLYTSSYLQNLDTLTLPHLRRLAVSDPAFLSQRLSTRDYAPTLQNLYVVGGLEHIIPFLQPSGCTELLTALTLPQCTAPTHEIIALLRCTRDFTALALDLRNPCSPAELVAALASPTERLCPTLGSLAWADFDDRLDRAAFADMIFSRCSGLLQGVHVLYAVAIYAGRRRMNTVGWRIRAIPGIEVRISNKKKGFPAVRRWRDY